MWIVDPLDRTEEIVNKNGEFGLISCPVIIILKTSKPRVVYV